MPIIVIDNREKTPLNFVNLTSEFGTLTSGDYSIRKLENKFAIERKSVSDLIGSLTGERDRFERECHRLRGYDFARLLIVGAPADIPEHLSRRKVTLRSLMGSLSTLEVRYRLPVVWESSPEKASLLIERWAWYYFREIWRPFKALPSPVFKSPVE